MLQDPAEILALISRLSRCPDVAKFDTRDETEAETLAHALADLEQSFTVMLNVHFPRLKSELTPEELAELLHEIGEELRHITYHVRDPRFYRYLLDDDSER